MFDTRTVCARWGREAFAIPERRRRERFRESPGTCTQSGAPASGTPATDLCAKLTLNVYEAGTATGTPIYSGTLTGFTAAVQLKQLAPNATQPYTFVIAVPSTLDNSY